MHLLTYAGCSRAGVYACAATSVQDSGWQMLTTSRALGSWLPSRYIAEGSAGAGAL
jgi:hypothetical protein